MSRVGVKPLLITGLPRKLGLPLIQRVVPVFAYGKCRPLCVHSESIWEGMCFSTNVLPDIALFRQAWISQSARLSPSISLYETTLAYIKEADNHTSRSEAPLYALWHPYGYPHLSS